jgi:hypothetical protein
LTNNEVQLLRASEGGIIASRSFNACDCNNNNGRHLTTTTVVTQQQQVVTQQQGWLQQQQLKQAK